MVPSLFAPGSVLSLERQFQWNPGQIVQCQDTLDPVHLAPKTFRHHQTSVVVSGQFGTSAEVSRGHFGTGTELSRPPANIYLYRRK